ncbi:MAG: VWA domain-containing protein, partial [Chitinivibrionia bacterium]|nr:VWA domain-containing protein [Chitinivibrionia bacterium]
LVVFDDLPLPAVPPELLAFLPRYVHDLGGGFLMVGGEGGFGPGGYGETAVETLMPVRMKIPAGARTEGMELILLLDKSGSMDEGEETRTKWDRAVEAAASAMKVLRKGDAAGVIAFDGEAHEIVPLARNPDLEEVGRRLRGITPGGGTDIAGGLDKALAVFSAPDRGTPIRSRRHLILLSDGKTQRKEFAGIFRRLNQREVTVSVIAIGEDPDTEILKTLTAGTGGRFYRVMERDLPAGVLEALFRRDTLAASEQWIVTESFRPRLRDPLDGVEKGLLRHHGELPPMKGYVRTTPKKSSRIVLESDRGDPIIAAWHYGAGRSAALTTDGTGRWSGVWLNWPPFQETFGGLARWILAPRREGAKDPGREAWERIFLPETREETGRSPDYLILTRITEMTGGRFLRPEDNPFHPEKGETPSGGTRAVCLPAILVLFLVDVGYHRRFGMFSKDAG